MFREEMLCACLNLKFLALHFIAQRSLEIKTIRYNKKLRYSKILVKTIHNAPSPKKVTIKYRSYDEIQATLSSRELILRFLLYCHNNTSVQCGLHFNNCLFIIGLWVQETKEPTQWHPNMLWRNSNFPNRSVKKTIETVRIF